jgi:hypothetical protein
VFCRWFSSPNATNCTLADNWALDERGRALACFDLTHPSDVTITNCILWNGGDEIWSPYDSIITITYSDVAGSWPGEGNIDADPLFVTGPLGEYYLGQTAAGQPANSPCVDAGSDTAENLGLDTLTTRTDQAPDSGIVDMGCHYPVVCPGDIDGDGHVDLADLAILLAAYDACDGDPFYDPAADLDDSGCVDLADLATLLAVYGTDCP